MPTFRVTYLALGALCLWLSTGSSWPQALDSSRQGSASYGGGILSSQERRVIAPLLPHSILDAITDELSGDLTMQHIEVMSLYQRTEHSREFKQSAEHEPLRAMTQYMGPLTEKRCHLHG